MPRLSDEPLNTILYGPPGTGKTYTAIERAVRIADPAFRFTEHAEAKQRYAELVREGRIEFVVFHPSYQYEDFLEGRQAVSAEGLEGSSHSVCKAGALKQIALRALNAILEPVFLLSALTAFATLWDILLARLQENPELTGATPEARYHIRITSQRELYATSTPDENTTEFFGVTQSVMEQLWTLARDLTSQATTQELTAVAGHIEHADFAASVFRVLKEIENTLPDEPGAGPSADMTEEAIAAYLSGSTRNEYRIKPPDSWLHYVLILDEMDQGDIRKILGESIALLDEDKRLPGENTLTVALPCSRERFALPANLHILGTMRTTPPDAALHRRFAFEELPPDFSLCKDLTPEMRAVLETLNRRIAIRKGSTYRIGHAFFRDVSDEASFDRVFARKIAPLLRDYFAGDWDGLRFVLGESGDNPGFVHRRDSGGETHWQWHMDAGEPVNALQTLRQNYS